MFEGELRIEDEADAREGRAYSRESHESEEGAEVCEFGGGEPWDHRCEQTEVDICPQKMEIASRIQVKEDK